MPEADIALKPVVDDWSDQPTSDATAGFWKSTALFLSYYVSIDVALAVRKFVLHQPHVSFPIFTLVSVIVLFVKNRHCLRAVQVRQSPRLCKISDQLSAEMGIKSVPVCVTGYFRGMNFVAGLFNRRILLFDVFLQDKDEAAAEFMIAHELAHLKVQEIIAKAWTFPKRSVRILFQSAVWVPIVFLDKLSDSAVALALAAIVLYNAKIYPLLLPQGLRTSQEVELACDAIAVRTTRDPESAIRLLEEAHALGVDPKIRSHPSLAERIENINAISLPPPCP